MADNHHHYNWGGHYPTTPPPGNTLETNASIQTWVDDTESNPNGATTQSQCGIGDACDDEECDPQSIVPCGSVTGPPCYDPSCAPYCELDGQNLGCNDPHALQTHESTVGIYQSNAPSQFVEQPMSFDFASFNPHHPPQTGFNVANTGEQFYGLPPQMPVHNGYPSVQCSHPVDHAGRGCIAPLQIHLNPSPEMRDMARIGEMIRCCCDPGSSHLPNRNDVFAMFHPQHHHQPQQLQTNGTDVSLVQPQPDTYNIAIRGTLPTETSLPADLALSHSTQIPMEQHPTVRSSGTSDELRCRWKNPKTAQLCGIQCIDSVALQQHIQMDHLPQHGKRGNKVPDMVCHWQGCRHGGSGKSFHVLQHLRDHVRTHTHNKPHVCEFELGGKVCGMAFGEAKALKTHTRSHTHDRPYKCQVCGKSFKHSVTLKNHQKQHTVQPKKYRCPECKHEDNDRANLTRHIDTHYASRFSCKMCHKVFSKKANASRHLLQRSCKAFNNWPIAKDDIEAYIHTAECTRAPIDFNALEIHATDNGDSSVQMDNESTDADEEDTQREVTDDELLGYKIITPR